MFLKHLLSKLLEPSMTQDNFQQAFMMARRDHEASQGRAWEAWVIENQINILFFSRCLSCRFRCGYMRGISLVCLDLPGPPRTPKGPLFGQFFLQGPHRDHPGSTGIPRGRRFACLFVCLFVCLLVGSFVCVRKNSFSFFVQRLLSKLLEP